MGATVSSSEGGSRSDRQVGLAGGGRKQASKPSYGRPQFAEAGDQPPHHKTEKKELPLVSLRRSALSGEH